jgi:hypothetical protein
VTAAALPEVPVTAATMRVAPMHAARAIAA